MSLKVLQAFVVLVLLVSPQISGEEKLMVCKDAKNVFSDVRHQPCPSDTNITRLVGPPGKKGVPGSQGLPGLPGIQGIPGIPATVDYDRISEMIKEQVRQGLERVNTKVEHLQSNFTKLMPMLQGLEGVNTKVEDLQSNFTKLMPMLQEQPCTRENGLLYDGTCYILPDVSIPRDVSYEQAIQQCNVHDAVVAEVHSKAHQQALQDFFQTRIPSFRNFNILILAMVYQSSDRSLRFRSGKQVSADQFRWAIGNPFATGSRVGVQISGPSRAYGNKWFLNVDTRYKYHGVICEKIFLN